MTRKHFEMIQAALLIEVLTADQNGRKHVAAVAERLAEQFAAINNSFDRDRFLRGCGVIKEA